MSEKFRKVKENIDYSKFLSKEKHVIFLFHGVINRHRYKVRNYMRKHISFERFEAVINSLNSKGKCISMNDVYNILSSHKAYPPFSYSITFDDGFANNLDIASPYLTKLNLPHTVYVTTSFIEDDSLSWIDKIEYAFEKTNMQKIYLDCLDLNFDLSTAKKKINALNKIRAAIKSSQKYSEEELVKEVFLKLKISEIKNDSELDKKISWKQIKKHSKNELLSIGGHGHNHKILSFLSSQGLEYEISNCLKLLREKAGISTMHFSYPEGLKHCYSEKVKKYLRKFGIKLCPTAIHGLNDKTTSPFDLKRINVV